MSLTRAAFHVHRHLEFFIPLPYLLDKSNLAYLPNPKYHQRCHKIFRISMQTIITFVHGLTTYRLFWLFFNWKTYSVYHLQECVLLFIAWNLIIMEIVFCLNVIKSHEVIREGGNQAIKICYGNKLNRKLDIIALIGMYGLYCEMWCTPLVAFISPVFIDNDPIQLFFGTSIPVKLTVSIIYLLIFSYGVTFIMSLMLTAAAFLEMQVHFSNKLAQSTEKGIPDKTATLSEFDAAYHNFALLRILFILGTEMCNLAFTGLIFIGVLIVTCTAYCTIAMYNRLPIIIYLVMPFATLVGFVIALIFTRIASISADNAHQFKLNWAKKVKQRRARMLLASAPKLGYGLGPYGEVTREMGLTVCDDYIQNTVDLLLMMQG